MRRLWATAGVLVLMAGFGLGVNRYLAGTAKVGQINDSSIRHPTDIATSVDVPGTVYLVQRGALFRLSGRRFTQLQPPRSGQWLQPAPANDGARMLAVLRSDQSSDLYLLDADGNIAKQLTHNAAKQIDANHWIFWPHMSADGTTLFTSYDSPKNGYNVDLAVWSGSLDGPTVSHRWTTPNPYTGGDVHAVPAPSGGIIYSRYSIQDGKVYSQVVRQATMSSEPVALTTTGDDCDQPALSPDGASVAMVCSQAKQSTRLVVAHLAGQSFDTQHVVVADCLCASPAWAPDGSGLAYLAPPDPSGHFQLWWVAGAGSAAPQQVTTNLDFDATSPPAWMSGPVAQPAP